MLKFLPLLLAIGWGIAMMRFSVWRTRRELDERSSPLDDARLRPHIGRLARALDLPQIKVNLYDIPTVNGLAAPDGRIFLTRGFINQLDQGRVTPEEITSVVAHELGHVALGHGRRRMSDFASQNAMRLGLTVVVARFLPLIGPWVINGLISLLAARLSRDDEFEADAYASALLLKSGIGTDPQITLFEKLDRMNGGAGNTAWMSSHPATAARIEAIENNRAKWLEG